MTLRCIGCGKFISTKVVHASGSNHVCHMTEKCLTVLIRHMKKNCVTLDFYTKDSMAQIMHQIFNFGRED